MSGNNQSESNMPKDRVAEVALLLQEWQYRQLGTEKYMGELKAAGEDLKISDKEMFEFFHVIFERMRNGNQS